MEHASIHLIIAIIVLMVLIIGAIFRARSGKNIFIRRIPGLNEIDEAVGRATEMGTPVLFHPGIGEVQEIPTIAALGVLGHVAKQSARMGTRVIVVTKAPPIVPIAEDIVKQAYQTEGKPELFDNADIRFLAATNDQLALASADLMKKERTSAHFFFGVYDYTSLLVTEPGNHLGAMQIAGTSDYFQVPFFIASCDYTIIGEELYAASAYLTRESTMLGSLIGQDYAKIIILVLIVIGVLASTAVGTNNIFIRLMELK